MKIVANTIGIKNKIVQLREECKIKEPQEVSSSNA